MTLTSVFLIWVVVGGALFLYLKERIVNIAIAWKLPWFITYLILLTPLVLVEESLTCETPLLFCIAATYPAFLIMFFVLSAAVLKFKLSFWQAVIFFGLMGWVNEFMFVGRIYSLSSLTLALMSILAFLIYAVLAIIPAEYLRSVIKRTKIS